MSNLLYPGPIQTATGAPPPQQQPMIPQQQMQQPTFAQRFGQNMGPILQALGMGIASNNLAAGAAALPGLSERRREQAMQQQAMAQEEQRKNATVEWLKTKDPEVAALVAQGAIDPLGGVRMAEERRLQKQKIANMPQDDYLAAGAGKVFNKRTGEWVPNPGMETGASTHDPAATGSSIPKAAPGITGKPLTEGQSKDVTYSTRARGALEKLEPIADELTGLRGSVAGNVPIVGNYLKPERYQAAEQAGNEFLQAILRKDTGAAITPDEQELYGKTFLPQPGDGPEVLQAKREARARALAAIEAGMPANAILAQGQALQGLGEAQAAPATEGVPEGVDPGLWEVMTPEERALWN